MPRHTFIPAVLLLATFAACSGPQPAKNPAPNINRGSFSTDAMHAVTVHIVPRDEIRPAGAPRGFSAFDLDAFAAGKPAEACLFNPEERAVFSNAIVSKATYIDTGRGQRKEQVTLAMYAADSGFVSFTPAVGTPALSQMNVAPVNGYTRTIVLDPARFAELTSSRAGIENDLFKHHSFYYFRAQNKYGRLEIQRDPAHDEGLDLTIEMQLTGSRELPDVPR